MTHTGSIKPRCVIWGTLAPDIRIVTKGDRVTVYNSPRAGGSYSILPCTVSVEGLSRLEVARHAARPNQAFVAMWCDDSMDDRYLEGIRPGFENAGYTACRIDQTATINRIDDAIIREICRSRFMVADFTQGVDGNGGNVYYEAGVTRGLGLPVISTCPEEQFSTLAFDTRQFLRISWSEPAELTVQLAKHDRSCHWDGTYDHLGDAYGHI